MFGSLRIRLPALFLLGVVLAGILASAISIRFFQSYTRSRAISELRSESVGITQLYAKSAGASEVPVTSLQAAIGGDHIFLVPIAPGVELFTGNLPTLPPRTLDVKALGSGGTMTVDDLVDPRGKHYLAVARPITLSTQLLGALVVAKPKSQLRSRLLVLVWQLLIAFGVGVIVVGLLGVYL